MCFHIINYIYELLALVLLFKICSPEKWQISLSQNEPHLISWQSFRKLDHELLFTLDSKEVFSNNNKF